jgi:hypothetical protein
MHARMQTLAHVHEGCSLSRPVMMLHANDTAHHLDYLKM